MPELCLRQGKLARVTEEGDSWPSVGDPIGVILIGVGDRARRVGVGITVTWRNSLIPALVGAIKELQAEIAELRADIADLKSKLAAGPAH